MPENTKPDLPLMLRVKLSIGSFLLERCMRSDDTINRRLFSLIDPKIRADFTKVVDNVRVTSSDIFVDSSAPLWFRLFVPETTKNLPLVVYFHGGGFACLEANSMGCDDFCRTLAGKIPAIIASVNYRLAPEHKWPSQYDDGFDTLKFINSQNYSILPHNTYLTKCFLAGDSAGANIAHHVAIRVSQKLHVFDKIVITGLVALQPFFGGEERTEFELRLTKAPILNVEGTDRLWRMFLPAGTNRNHPAVNVFGGGDEKEIVECMKSLEFPKSLVIVGGFDPLQDWQRRYVKGLKKCGKEVEMVEYPNAFHSFYAFQELPEFALLVEDVRRFINL